ncbi:MAG: DUF4342 domain-containing protein [Lutispora sp.]|nr:DUF4342 domain-containing protein [Lutispora sp.]MDD4834891.1 DUF4342 domain-containing protein [Lutispora sp.]
MVTLDQVEKLRQKADVSYDEAKAALEETNGDILEAVINLERQNRIKTPEGGGYFNSKNAEHSNKHNKAHMKAMHENRTRNGSTFGELIGKFLRWCGSIIGKGNRNHFEITKDGNSIISMPVTVLAVLLLFAFWIIVPLVIVGLFFGYKYTFNGPDLGKENVNRAMSSAADAAEKFKKEFKGEGSNGENSNS